MVRREGQSKATRFSCAGPAGRGTQTKLKPPPSSSWETRGPPVGCPVHLSPLQTAGMVVLRWKRPSLPIDHQSLPRRHLLYRMGNTWLILACHCHGLTCHLQLCSPQPGQPFCDCSDTVLGQKYSRSFPHVLLSIPSCLPGWRRTFPAKDRDLRVLPPDSPPH